MEANIKWLVISLDVGDLGEWFFDTRKQALFFRKELIKTGAEPDNISLYYGKIIHQECNLPSYKGSGWRPNKWTHSTTIVGVSKE